MPDGEDNHPFLKTFGQPARELACECERESDSNLAQALHLINGSTINDKLRAALSKVRQAHAISGGAMIDELYVRALCRPATPVEHAEWEPLLAKDTDAAEDLLWALLNCREFSFNH